MFFFQSCHLGGHWWWFCCHRNRWGDDEPRARSAPSECRCRGGGTSARCGLLWCHTTCRYCLPDLWLAGGRWGPPPPRPLRFLFNMPLKKKVTRRTCGVIQLREGSRVVSHLSRAGSCPPLVRSWARAGPRTAPSCPGSQRQSSSPPTCTQSECDLCGQNGEWTES